MIRWASAGPIPSSVSSCSSEAELSETGAAGDAAAPGSVAAGALGAPRTGTLTCSPSVNRAARFTAPRSARRRGPALRTASSTRAPDPSRYTPGRRTAPDTSTTTTAGPGSAAGSDAVAGAPASDGYAEAEDDPAWYFQPTRSTIAAAAA